MILKFYFRRENNRYDLSNTDKWSTNQYGGGYWMDAGHRDPFDLTYSTGDVDNRPTDLSLSDGEGSYSDTGLGTDIPVESTVNWPYFGPSGSTPVVSRRPPNANRQPNYPSNRHSVILPQLKKFAVIPNVLEVDWRTIGIAALVKLALVKLKTFSVITVLLTVLFKLKLLLAAVLFKFHFLLKFTLLLLSYPAISTHLSPFSFLWPGLLTIPMQILSLLAMPTAPLPDSPTPQTTISTSRPTVPSRPSVPSRPTVPSRPSAPLTTRRPYSSFDPNSPDVSSGESDESAFKGIDSDVPYRQHYKASNLLNYASDIVHMLMNSKKYAERIACRMTVVKNAGIVSTWINW